MHPQRSPALPCIMLAGQLFTQGRNCLPNGHSKPCCLQQHPPAAPADEQRAMDRAQERRAQGQGQKQRGRRREGKVSWRLWRGSAPHMKAPGAPLQPQPFGKSQDALLLPSKHAANQCVGPGWCSCILKGPQHCFALCWLVSFPHRVAIACPSCHSNQRQ
jgi:hypothetical protein